MTNQVDVRDGKVVMNTFAGWRTVTAVNGNWVTDSQGRSWMVTGDMASAVRTHMNMRDAWVEVEAHANDRW